MTALNDFDRVLDEWLHEGPNRAPDRPIELAMEHARSHPRRRDPLAFLRPDPMAPRSRGLGMGLRPGLVLAVLGLLLAAVAIGVGGSRQPSVVVPTDTSLDYLPDRQPDPVCEPHRAGLGRDPRRARRRRGPAADGRRHRRIRQARRGELRFTDRRSGQSFPFDDVEVTNIDATTLQLGWAGYPCRTDHDLLIGPTRWS